MRYPLTRLMLALLVPCLAIAVLLASYGIPGRATASAAAADGKKWAMNATIIEACSCPMFCQCYFNPEPGPAGGHGSHDAHAAHGAAGGADAPAGGHFCRFNNAYSVNSGSFGDTRLDGAKFWIGGDLGGDFSKGEMDWAVLTFDPSVTPAQREGIRAIIEHVYPVKWKGGFTVAADAPIEWAHKGNTAVARLDGGKRAEVVLKQFPGNDSTQPIVIRNLKYWGVPRNDGFILMPNEVQALRVVPEGKTAFEFKGSNGFMITFDIKSDDVKP